jgi:hypothetical protein
VPCTCRLVVVHSNESDGEGRAEFDPPYDLNAEDGTIDVAVWPKS